jgi:hypothetical protein
LASISQFRKHIRVQIERAQLTALTVDREYVERERHESIKRKNTVLAIDRAVFNSFPLIGSTVSKKDGGSGGVAIDMLDKTKSSAESNNRGQSKASRNDDRTEYHSETDSNNNNNTIDDYLAFTPEEIDRLYVKVTEKSVVRTERFIRKLEQQLHQANADANYYQSRVTKYETTISNLYD